MMKNKKNLVSSLISYIIILTSFGLRAYYVLKITVYKNQHDGGAPFAAGQLGYISYFLQNNHFPDFDVSKVDQFWHPPLHYIISAKFLKVVWALFPAQNGNFEFAQILPLLYVTLSILLIYKSLKLLFPEDVMICNIGLLFAAFQPSFLFRSATINNDALATLLSIASLYVLLRYICRSDLKRIEKEVEDVQSSIRLIMSLLILFILGMWTKKSVILIAAPIGFLFIYETITGKKRKLIISSILFLFTAPISFGWYLWMYFRWGIPLDFVWDIMNPEFVPGYIKDVSPLARMLDFSPLHFKYQYVFVSTNTKAIDINPLTVLVKTSANDLWFWSYVDNGVVKLSYLILLLRMFFTLVICVALVVYILDKNMTIRNKLVIVSFMVFSLLGFYAFAFKEPYICSMNYRYIEPIILCETVLTSYLATRNRMARFTVALACIVLVGASILKIFMYQSLIFNGGNLTKLFNESCFMLI